MMMKYYDILEGLCIYIVKEATVVVPQLWLCRRLAEVTPLEPGWVLQVGHTGDSRTVQISLVTGEPVREVERRGRQGLLWSLKRGSNSVMTLLQSQNNPEKAVRVTLKLLMWAPGLNVAALGLSLHLERRGK